MSYGPIQVFSVGMASATTFTSMFSLPNAYSRTYLEVPTMSTAADLFLVASTDGSTFRRVMQVAANTSTVQVNTFTIASAAAGAGGRMVEVPANFPYLKVEASSAPASAAVFKLICAF